MMQLRAQASLCLLRCRRRTHCQFCPLRITLPYHPTRYTVVVRRFILFIARKHVRHRVLQSTLTVLGVAMGVMVLVTALSLTNGFIEELLRSTLRATPHITLQSFGFGGRPDLPSNADELQTILETPGVVAASPFVAAQILIARRADAQRGIEGRTGFAQLLGINPATHQHVLELEVLEQTVSELHDAQGVVLGRSLARSLGVFVEDEVMITDIHGRRQVFTVVGTFSVGNEMIDGVSAFVSIPNLQAFLRTPEMISGYHVRVQDPQNASAVAAQLGERLGLFATTWQGIFSLLINQLNLQRAVISAVVFLIVLVAAIGIANILILTVAEKTEEIAVLRAMGASQRQILAVFTFEGLLLGGGGTLLGAILGLSLSLYFRYQPFPLPGELYYITQLPVEIRAWDFLWVCGLSIITSVLAALLPARRASRLNPAELLR
jgi:lipoprotein-releasing system permease protein